MTTSLFLLVLWSCAAQTTPPTAASSEVKTAAPHPLGPASERAVKTRASAWWLAREHRDHQRMYDLFEPTYRKQVPFADSVKESAVRTRFDLGDPRVDSVVPEAPDRVRVKVTGHVTAEDTWVRVSRQWSKVHEPVSLPFPTTPR